MDVLVKASDFSLVMYELLQSFSLLKWIVHQKIAYILTWFTHPLLVPNQYEFLSSVEQKRRYSEECW